VPLCFSCSISIAQKSDCDASLNRRYCLSRSSVARRAQSPGNIIGGTRRRKSHSEQCYFPLPESTPPPSDGGWCDNFTILVDKNCFELPLGDWLGYDRDMPKIGKTETNKRKTGKRGRPATGRDPSVTIRLPASLLEWVDNRAKDGRSELIRRLLEEARLRNANKRQRESKPLPDLSNGGLQIISAQEANRIIGEKHYLGAVEYTPRFCITTAERDAVAVYSPPVASHFKRIPGFTPIELARLWQSDETERPLSQFLAASLRWLRKLAPEVDCVFSYADPAARHTMTKAPHRGTIYQATNFAYVGESRATDSWRTSKGEVISSPVCYRRYKTKSRAKIQALNPKWKLIPGEPKRLFVYGLKSKPDEVLARIKGRYA
jgi:Arc/MetJ-type ribon-helix-helix transcriptional regulator